MEAITGFWELRADGKTILPGMGLKDMLRLGWAPSIVVAIGWVGPNGAVEIKSPNGISTRITPSGRYVAALISSGNSNCKREIYIFGLDGSLFGKIFEPVILRGKELRGCFQWLEEPMSAIGDNIGVIFRSVDNMTVWCDVDVEKLKVVSAEIVR